MHEKEQGSITRKEWQSMTVHMPSLCRSGQFIKFQAKLFWGIDPLSNPPHGLDSSQIWHFFKDLDISFKTPAKTIIDPHLHFHWNEGLGKKAFLYRSKYFIQFLAKNMLSGGFWLLSMLVEAQILNYQQI